MAKQQAAVAETPVVQATVNTLPADVMSESWGAVEAMDTTDLLVPKIFHQQAMSKFVADGIASPGDFCDSLTGTLLAKKADPLEVIVFGCYKTMVVSKFEDRDNAWRLEKTVTITPENAKEWAAKPMLMEENGWKFKNTLQYNFYCLLPKMISELPFVLSLGSTKSRAAKKLNTMLYKLQALKRPGASVVFELRSVPEKNDKGSWFGLDITQGRAATSDELSMAHVWYMKSKTQKFVASEEPQAEAATSEEVPF